MTTTRTFRDGDKAVVESPVFIVGADTVTPHYLGNAPKVGDVVTVVEAAAFGPKEVGTTTGYRMAVEGLIHLDDIDALAKERANLQPGDKVRVDRAYFHGLDGDIREHADFGNSEDRPKVGDVLTVERLDGYRDGIPHVVFEETLYVNAAAGVSRVEPDPEPEPATTLGTAEVRVTVRVFIGDTDITSLIDTHALEALASAKDKEAQA